MWGKPLFYIPETFEVEVSDLDVAQAWYQEKLGFRVTPKDSDADGRSVVLSLPDDIQDLVLTQKAPTPRPKVSLDREPPPILFTRKLAKTREWLMSRGVAAGPIQSDSSGTNFFRFQDLEGHSIEVCRET